MKLIFILRKEDTNLLQISPTLTGWQNSCTYHVLFEKINSLNLSLQGKSIDILTAYNKIKAFKKKIQHWASRVEIGKMDMFSELLEVSRKKRLFQRKRV